MADVAEAERATHTKWWREAITIFVFYELYSLARNTAPTSRAQALHNATAVIHAEKTVGLFVERRVQVFFLHSHAFVKALNVYYGTAHFVVTLGVMGFLYLRHPDRYVRLRWILGATTALALIGFVFYPVMPPRMLVDSYGFQDTLKTIGGLWSFEDGPIAKLSNQYAAMPSLHFGWSMWCTLALWPRLRHWWTKALAAAHPVVTTIGIVATANHFWLDAAGGGLVLLAGWVVGGWLATHVGGRYGSWEDARRSRRQEADAVPAGDG
jgi:hypothetical protein